VKLIIGNKNYSSWSLRPWLVLKQLGISFEEELIPLYRETSSQEVLRYSPSGKVPALIDEEIKIWDSLAICEYLNEKFPRAQLWPENEKARAVARSVSAEMHSGFQALRQNLSMNIRREKIQKEFSPEVEKEIQHIQNIWSHCLNQFGAGGKFLFGPFTIADAMFAPVTLRFRIYGLYEKCDGVLQSYMDEVYRLPALQEWVESAKNEDYVISKFE